MRPRLPARVTVVEVGPRDGLQNQSVRLDVATKVAFIEGLAAAGLPVIEAAAFVSPAWVPQMADAAEVLQAVRRRESVRYPVLVPNTRGLERALAAGAREVAVVTAATESFSRRNLNQSVEETLAGIAGICERAGAAGVPVRAYVSTVFGCPFEGPVPVAAVLRVTERLLELGAFEVALSDTIGVAHPGQVWDVLGAVTRIASAGQLALHLHDTRGTALASVLAGLEAGITTFDASAGGLGGCPYAPGATGNLATEDLIYMLDGLGIATGVSLERLAGTSRALEAALGHALPSRYLRATAATGAG